MAASFFLLAGFCGTGGTSGSKSIRWGKKVIYLYGLQHPPSPVAPPFLAFLNQIGVGFVISLRHPHYKPIAMSIYPEFEQVAYRPSVELRACRA